MISSSFIPEDEGHLAPHFVVDFFFFPPSQSIVFQEDISKLRRKIEKAKKPAEKISNGDEILNEEINEYKVRTRGIKNRKLTFITILCWNKT